MKKEYSRKKVVILGDGSVGKTSLLRGALDQVFDDNRNKYIR